MWDDCDDLLLALDAQMSSDIDPYAREQLLEDIAEQYREVARYLGKSQ